MNSDPFVEYRVEIDNQKLEISVEATFKGDFVKGEFKLEIPSWVPGDYDFTNYARDLFDLKAFNKEDNKELVVKKDKFSSFIIQSPGTEVVVNYKAYAYEIEYAEGSGILDSEYAILLGNRYLHSPKYLGECTVDYVKLPEDWKIHHPSGAQKIDGKNAWVYPGFEILLDTPVVFGKFSIFESSIMGTDFYYLYVDKGVGFDEEVGRFNASLSDAAFQAYEIFGEFPFENYTFIMSLNPENDWGLEHLSSSMCGLGPEVFVDEDQFATGVRVCAHELFHAWNVRRLRPAPLNDLKHHLTDGCFTQGLWMAEGFTRYYEFLISARAKAYTADQFFSAIAGYYSHLTSQPAYERVSGVDSSLGTYLNHSKYSGRVNNSIDYYDKGMLIAFGIDSELRSLKDGKDLDKAFSQFYKEFVSRPQPYPGYTTQDVVAYFNEVSYGLGEKIARAVESPGGLETEKQFESIGFKVNIADKYYLGLVFEDASEPVIYNITDTSPAAQTGIAPNDKITQINGFSFSEKTLSWAASHSAPVTLTVERGHRQLQFTIQPETRSVITNLEWTGSEDQARSIQNWLGDVNFAPQPGQIFSVDFYENFHGIETLL